MIRPVCLSAFAALALTACQPEPPGTADRDPAPWNMAGQAVSLFDAEGNPNPAFYGIWQSRGYGWILDINDTGMTRYQAGDDCYQTPDAARSLSAMASIEYRYARNTSDGDTAIFQLLEGDTHLVVDRLEALPDACLEAQPGSPVRVAEAFLDHFETHYAFFDRRHADHEARAEQLRASVRDTMSDAELWDALAGYMDGLSDSHSRLVGEVDGQMRRQQDGQGTTLPLIRDTMGEQMWLISGLLLAADGLGESGVHTLNDRLLWGIIEPEPGRRVGYLQLFVMGGFTDNQDFASDAWAEAEMSAFNAALDEAMAAFQDTDAVVVDLSNNRGGWDQIAKALAARFTDTAFVGYTTQPHDAQLAPYFHVIEPAGGPRYTGQVRLITSDVTVSGGELATLAMRQLPNVIHYGAPTRGSFSTPLSKPLPNGWLLELSNEVFAAPDGSVFEETGITPQVELQIFPAEDPIGGHWQAVMLVAG